MNDEPVYARFRKGTGEEDANKFGVALVGIDSNAIDWNTETFLCWQPDELDEEEYNLILWCPKRHALFRAHSFDFDFE
jgi:hypothetical protein